MAPGNSINTHYSSKSPLKIQGHHRIPRTS